MAFSLSSRAGQGSAKPANPHRPAPISTDPAGFLVFFAGCGLDFNVFLRGGGGGCGFTKKFYADTRPAPHRPAIYNLPKKCPSLSHFLTTHPVTQIVRRLFTLQPLTTPSRVSDLSGSRLSLSRRQQALFSSSPRRRHFSLPGFSLVSFSFSLSLSLRNFFQISLLLFI
jgi:hypothetical protein